MTRAYQLVDPSLNYPHARLNQDEETRVLWYLMMHLEEFATVPEGLTFEIIAARYVGPPGPVIGFYPWDEDGEPESLTGLALRLTDQMRTYAFEIGLDRLLALSVGLPVTWAHVLERQFYLDVCATFLMLDESLERFAREHGYVIDPRERHQPRRNLRRHENPATVIGIRVQEPSWHKLAQEPAIRYEVGVHMIHRFPPGGQWELASRLQTLREHLLMDTLSESLAELLAEGHALMQAWEPLADDASDEDWRSAGWSLREYWRGHTR